MCGLIGVVGDYGKEGRRVFQELLYVNTLRGFDSTGIFNATFLKERKFVKKAIPAPDFLGLKAVDSLISANSRVMVGHNRAATRGKINSCNAHPFEFENIMGVHNGTLTERWLLDDYRDFDVDSENLFYHLQRNGLQSTIDKCDGAYALVWHDLDDNTINLYRNDQRPLWHAYTEDRKAMYWASEGDMLVWILERNRVKYKEVIELPEETLLSIDIPKVGDVLQMEVTKVEPTPKPAPVSYLPYKRVGDDSSKKDSTSSKTSSWEGEVDDLSNSYKEGDTVDFVLDYMDTNSHEQEYVVGSTADVHRDEVRIYLQQNPALDRCVGNNKLYTGVISKVGFWDLTVSPHSVYEVITYKGYDNKVYPALEFKAMLNKGCSWCSNPYGLEAADSVLWISKDEYLCEHCREQDDVKQYIRG